MYYIYAYIDPRTDLPFYIGKGKNNRKFSHLREQDETSEKVNLIKEIQLVGLEPKIIELESNIEDEAIAYNRENYYILIYGRRGIEANGILTNKALHGQPPKPIWDSSRKKRHSEWNKSYWTPERINEHKTKNLKPLTTAGREKISQSSIGTVPVTDLEGNSLRVSKAIFTMVDRTGPLSTHTYVAVSSKEARLRKSLKNTP